MTTSKVAGAALLGGLLVCAGGAWAVEGLGTNQTGSGSGNSTQQSPAGTAGEPASEQMNQQDPACLPAAGTEPESDCKGAGGSTDSGSGEDEGGTSSGSGSTGGGGTAPGMTTPGAAPSR